MQNEKEPPVEFANRVIRQFVDNFYGDDRGVEPDDYTQIRLVFRRLGGNWYDLCRGSVPQLLLMVRVVKAWGKR